MEQKSGNGNFYLNKYREFSDSKKKNYAVINRVSPAPKKLDPGQNFEKLEIKDLKAIISKKKLSAIFLILSGTDTASRIISDFNYQELSKIIGEIISTGAVTEEEYAEVKKTFGDLKIAGVSSCKGGVDYARALLQKAFGLEKGSRLLVDIIENENADKRSLSFLSKLPDSMVLDIIGAESDNVISLITGLLDKKLAARLIKHLPHDRAANIIKISSNLKKIDPSVIETVVSKIKQRSSSYILKNEMEIKGKEKLVEILKNIPQQSSESIINNIEADLPELAKDIKEKIFTFNDILFVPKKSLVYALKNYKDKDIAFLLKGSDGRIKDFFLSCVTKQRQTIIKEESSYLGAVKKKEAEEKRKDFIEYLKKLEASGKIILKPDNEIYVE